MTLEQIHFLTSAKGQDLLALGANIGVLTKRLKVLRQQVNSDQAAWISMQIELREKARNKFSHAAKMIFDRQGLEQSTAQIISSYIGKRFSPFSWVTDLTCGIGGDAIGISKYVPELIVIDRFFSKVAICSHNLKIYQRNFYPIVADVQKFLPNSDAYFIDPSRRVAGKRVCSLEQSQPGLATIQKILKKCPHLAIKASPALDYSNLPFPCEVEVISVAKECREIVLWLGQLANTRYRATILPQGFSIQGEKTNMAPLSDLQTYLYEVHPAALRANLLPQLAEKHSLSLFDRKLGYLTGKDFVKNPWLTPYYIDKTMPFSQKKVRQELRKRQTGKLLVKSRGFVETPQIWQKRLKVPGNQSCVLFLMRVMGKPIALFTKES